MTNLSSLAGFSAGGSGDSSLPQLFTNNGAPVATQQIDWGDTAQRYVYHKSVIPAQCPSANLKARDTFGVISQYFTGDNTNGTTGSDCWSFSVNRSTGAITMYSAGKQNLWTNSGYGGVSTTYWIYEPIHGRYWSAGNNIYPGTTTNTMGATYGQIDTTGAATSTFTNTGGDHGFNGTFCATLPQSGQTQTFLSTGYTGNFAGFRIHEVDASNHTIGNWVANGSYSSAHSQFHCVYQPDQTVTTGEPNSITGTTFGSQDYGINVLRYQTQTYNDNGTTGDGFDSSFGALYQGHSSTGKSVWLQNERAGTLDSSNSPTSLIDGEPDLNQNMHGRSNYNQHTIGVGNNRYLDFHWQMSDSTMTHIGAAELWEFTSTNQPNPITQFSLGGIKSITNVSNYNSHFFPIYETDTSTSPKFIVAIDLTATGRYNLIRVYELNVDVTTYTP
jgi:hypothetical protein